MASSWLGRLWSERKGNVSVIIALTLVPVIGAIGMGAEASNWFLTQRALQNAADASVLAAVMNGCVATAPCHTTDLQPTYDQEAKSVAANFGFQNGGDTTVAASNTAPCPSGGNSCYGVKITRKVPFYLLAVVGFTGDTTTSSGTRAQTVSATSIAKAFPGAQYCVTVTGQDANPAHSALMVHGGPNVHFENCDAYAPNGGARCTGLSGNGNANNGGAFRSAYMLNEPNSQACPNPSSTADSFTDNFAAKASSIPSNPCSNTYHSAPTNGPNKNIPYTGYDITTASQLNNKFCGDIRLNSPTKTINITSDTTLYLYNGRLDMNGNTLQTTGNGHLTIVFTGTSGSYPHYIMTSTTNNPSVLNISSPGSGTWSGIAIYQDPNLPAGSNIDFNDSGANVAMDISGLFYAKNSNVTWSGNITYSTSGKQCVALLVKTLTINGSVNATTSQCTDQGLTGLQQAYNLAKLIQ